MYFLITIIYDILCNIKNYNRNWKIFFQFLLTFSNHFFFLSTIQNTENVSKKFLKKNLKKNSTKLQFKIKVQKDLLQHLLCDIKTKVGIRDEKKELGENTLVYFKILLIFLIENISFVNKKKNRKYNFCCTQKLLEFIIKFKIFNQTLSHTRWLIPRKSVGYNLIYYNFHSFSFK